MNGANMGAEALSVDDEPRGPERSGDRHVLINPDFDIGSVERFAPDQRRFHDFNPLVLAHLLAVRECARVVFTINTMEESAAVLQDGARGFFFKTDNLLPLHFGVPQGG